MNCSDAFQFVLLIRVAMVVVASATTEKMCSVGWLVIIVLVGALSSANMGANAVYEVRLVRVE